MHVNINTNFFISSSVGRTIRVNEEYDKQTLVKKAKKEKLTIRGDIY